MIQQLFSTDNNWVGLVLRLTLGLVIFPHAAQKLFGWFNGPGLSGEMQFLTQTVGLSAFVACMVIIVECLGTLLLLTGFATRIAALAMMGLFIGMIAVVHYKTGFFMNWFAQAPAGQEGFEYHLLVIGMCLAMLITGGGRFSLDRLLAQ
ncbi:DoxX family protein [Chitinophaga japonensis]|uniref:Putative oxidoreductase n=1 Tax=Chitinophaga japonensis TaxID=104662 RepID=A0A562T7Y9_CHIJA|nr:DoxX family protein [Chitinophaga japonensis]TWI89298.1 putative oxidoreductase [Chitinophaga japonensis]